VGHLTWLEALVIGTLQGVAELFPVSSLGHSILIPALIGGVWARDLDVSAPESPYLAFVVGLVFTASAADVTGIFSERSKQVNTLILNANDLLAVVDERRYAITSLLANISAVSRQLTGVVADNEKELAPALERLNTVVAMLEKNRDNLAKMLPGAAKYYLTQGEIVSNGAYYNALIPNIQPAQLLQPFLDYAFGFRRGIDAGQPPDNAGPRAELPFPVNGLPQPGDLPDDGNP